MIEKAINKILSLADPHLETVNGITYTDKPLTKVGREAYAKALELSSLDSLVEYIHRCPNDFKGGNPARYIIHVLSPTTVTLLSQLDGDREREILVRVRADLPEFPFGCFLDNEKMTIMMQSMFIDDADRSLVLKFVGTATSGSVKEYTDDGVTQKATIKQGVASKAEAVVPSPCILRPYRTFLEVEQPSSEFIFRMKGEENGNIKSAIIEADGGAWKMTAKANIVEYLARALEGTGMTIIA